MHPYTLLDVFVDEPLAGNGLAVVHDADGVSDAVMLGFARETTCGDDLRPDRPRAAGRLPKPNWTVAEEVPFAGHPSLGTVAVALRRGEREATCAGDTRGAPGGRGPARATAPGHPCCRSRRPSADELDPHAVMAAAGLAADDADPSLPPQMVTTGLPALIAPVASPDAIARIRPDRTRLRRSIPAASTSTSSWHGTATGAARARSIPSRPVEAEDPATGSAAGRFSPISTRGSASSGRRSPGDRDRAPEPPRGRAGR